MPIVRLAEELAGAPAHDCEATCTPFAYMRQVEPSRTTAQGLADFELITRELFGAVFGMAERQQGERV